MRWPLVHAVHPAAVARTKRAQGRPRAAIEMIGAGSRRRQVAQRPGPGKKAIAGAWRAFIHDPVGHCPDAGQRPADRDEPGAITLCS